MAIMDIYMIYQFIRKLVTPFTEMPAYRLGIIDNQGKFLKQRAQFTQAEQQACTYFDILIINLKRLIAKVPGGKSQLASYAAALLLTRTWESYQGNPVDTMFNLEEEFDKTLLEVEALYEDVPMNSTSVMPNKVVVNPRAASKYKLANILAQKKISKKNSPRRILGEETSLQYHSTLNPKLWSNNKLKDVVAGKLMQIAEAWMEFAKIDPMHVYDIIITGGNVNYNYTNLSDIDLHIVIARGAINPDRNFVDEYMQDKKILWTLTHPDISIYDYPVELYAQDIDEQPHQDQGVYSLTNKRWVQEPHHLDIDFESDYHLQKKVQFYKNMIDTLIYNNADDSTIDTVKKKIWTMRGDSIAKAGEFAFGNLIFKELRNMGYLDKIADYQKSRKDKALSLS
ncbi:hypothetical protein UFOVP247_49 [uncultured Caudovirales phage]|uniref:Uncharacterized protein n=1 Tax=uncultured Caudovirales phage TaxID=2100421 RepID=A0A6J7WVK5_9CAUD|nr:hypothetical protein UFOVP247_49 [uncultured Caudovirales phage]